MCKSLTIRQNHPLDESWAFLFHHIDHVQWPECFLSAIFIGSFFCHNFPLDVRNDITFQYECEFTSRLPTAYSMIVPTPECSVCVVADSNIISYFLHQNQIEKTTIHLILLNNFFKNSLKTLSNARTIFAMLPAMEIQDMGRAHPKSEQANTRNWRMKQEVQNSRIFVNSIARSC